MSSPNPRVFFHTIKSKNYSENYDAIFYKKKVAPSSKEVKVNSVDAVNKK